MSTISNEPSTIEEAAANLRKAQDDYERLSQECRIARSRECDALNQLNAAQIGFDSFVALMRKKSPQESDWRREKYTKSIT